MELVLFVGQRIDTFGGAQPSRHSGRYAQFQDGVRETDSSLPAGAAQDEGRLQWVYNKFPFRPFFDKFS